ncbi:hypothetical protein ABVF61_09815 [Roseibium sp. HPY-6]|uniref:hypothetical protein n=1 Tax=Roseibium sp. HPY-6 TaxID=3229852 RepID=UPI00338D3C93
MAASPFRPLPGSRDHLSGPDRPADLTRNTRAFERQGRTGAAGPTGTQEETYG